MKTILCDIGGVLLEVDFDRAITRISSESGFSSKELHERIFASGMKERHDKGDISPYELYKHIIPGDEITFERFEHLWGDIFSEKRDMVDYIISCAKSHRLFIASNTDPIHYNFFQKNYHWFSLFNGYGLSFRLKSIKPSTDFYARLCREFDIKYHDALFVDDLSENIEAANSLGIKSHLFKGMDGFKEFVENEGEE